MKRPSIYEYLDYRAYLRDLFGFLKETRRHFSHRFFAREAGFASPNYLKLVMDGKRNLTNESVAKVAKGFRLNRAEREFFENLVFMNQAPSHEERNHYYQRMMAVKGFAEVHRIDKASYDYFSKWYCPVIREIVGFGDRRRTPGEIARILDPPITPREAEKALKLLMDLGLIRKDADGRWEKVSKTVSTGPEVKSLVIANYHREMLRLAAESLERHPAAERDITSVTISVHRGRMAELKERTARFRRELLEMACDDEDADRVIQVNLQVYPLSR